MTQGCPQQQTCERNGNEKETPVGSYRERDGEVRQGRCGDDNRAKRKKRRKKAFPWKFKQVRRLVSRTIGGGNKKAAAMTSSSTGGSFGGARPRRSGLQTVSTVAPAALSGTSSLEEEEDHVNNNSVPNADLLENLNHASSTARPDDAYDEEYDCPPSPVASTCSSASAALPSLDQMRRMSDQTFKSFLDRFRRHSGGSAHRIEVVQGGGVEDADSEFKLPPMMRKMSVDSAGILKRGGGGARRSAEPDLGGGMRPGAEKLAQRRVSFSTHHNVRVFQPMFGEQTPYDIEESSLSEGDEEDDEEEKRKQMRSNISLIPTFVFPRNRPGFAESFKEAAVMLESVAVAEDLHLVGNIRVNLRVLQAARTEEEKSRTQRIGVGVTYSKDGWRSREDRPAMLVRSRVPKCLEGFETHCFRFAVDCSDLSVGETLQFAVWCADKTNNCCQSSSSSTAGATTSRVMHEDDNGKQFYSVRCSAKLNVWAQMAARELTNFAPTVRFNRNY